MHSGDGHPLVQFFVTHVCVFFELLIVLKLARAEGLRSSSNTVYPPVSKRHLVHLYASVCNACGPEVREAPGERTLHVHLPWEGKVAGVHVLWGYCRIEVCSCTFRGRPASADSPLVEEAFVCRLVLHLLDT